MTSPQDYYQTDLAGRRFGRLIAISYAGTQRGGGKFYALWHVECDCGTAIVTRRCGLVSGGTTSCGCSRTTHGKSYSSEYTIWHHMIRRCHYPKNTNFPIYGGRGIAVCDRWRFGENAMSGFECFLADMGDRPAELTVERKDNELGYSKDNCCWATRKTQARNKRTTLFLNVNGERKTMIQAAEDANLSYEKVYSRLKRGDTAERALR